MNVRRFLSSSQLLQRSRTVFAAPTRNIATTPLEMIHEDNREKKKMSLKLRYFTEKLLRHGDENGVSVTKSDLLHWAIRLEDKPQVSRRPTAYSYTQSEDCELSACVTRRVQAATPELAASRQRQKEKRKVLVKLKNLDGETEKVEETLNAHEEELKSGFITQADLFRWAKLLDKKYCEPALALEMCEWMERKKMTFSPSQLATVVELIGKTKGYDAAKAYFDKVEPNFDNMDSTARNYPAYQSLANIIFGNRPSGPGFGYYC